MNEKTGNRINVYLGGSYIQLAADLGQGNVSLGIRRALERYQPAEPAGFAAQEEPQPIDDAALGEAARHPLDVILSACSTVPRTWARGRYIELNKRCAAAGQSRLMGKIAERIARGEMAPAARPPMDARLAFPLLVGWLPNRYDLNDKRGRNRLLADWNDVEQVEALFIREGITRDTDGNAAARILNQLEAERRRKRRGFMASMNQEVELNNDNEV